MGKPFDQGMTERSEEVPNTTDTYCYTGFGLTVKSQGIALPELRPQSLGNAQDDCIEVVQSDLSRAWSEVADGDRKVAVRNNEVFIHIPGVAIYCVKRGREIVVSPVGQADFDKIRLYILGTCIGILLMQRKVLPLHGSAVEMHGKAYAIVGDSGAGKSTLATTLLSRGFRLISDDVIAVRHEEGSLPFAAPAYPQQKLWEESLVRLDMDVKEKRPLFEREKKFAVPVASNFCPESLPLSGIFELCKSENNEVEIQKLQGAARLPVLYRHTYRNFILSRLGLLDWHFHTSLRLLSAVEVYRIQRPTAEFTARQLADAMESIVENHGKQPALPVPSI